MTIKMRTNKNKFLKFGQNDRACMNRKTLIQTKKRFIRKKVEKTNYKNFCKLLSPTILTVYAVVGTSSA